MSTNFDHPEKNNHLSFETIDRRVQKFDILLFTSPAAVQTTATRTERLVAVYGTTRPILVAVTAIPFIPAAWRAVLTVFTTTLDEISASFKAGKDLATAPVDGAAQVAMEPKLPVG
jgi:hypothetical protein